MQQNFQAKNMTGNNTIQATEKKIIVKCEWIFQFE